MLKKTQFRKQDDYDDDVISEALTRISKAKDPKHSGATMASGKYDPHGIDGFSRFNVDFVLLLNFVWYYFNIILKILTLILEISFSFFFNDKLIHKRIPFFHEILS